MMKGIWQGLVAGLLAGAVLAALSFVDNGNGNQLASVASWLGLTTAGGTARWMGFLLLLLLGGLFGTLFGAVQSSLHRRTQLTLGRSLVAGLLFWVIIRFFLGVLINHQQLDLTGFLYSFVPLLLYGLLLGSIFFQRAASKEG
jgi:hypothetical protein